MLATLSRCASRELVCSSFRQYQPLRANIPVYSIRQFRIIVTRTLIYDRTKPLGGNSSINSPIVAAVSITLFAILLRLLDIEVLTQTPQRTVETPPRLVHHR